MAKLPALVTALAEIDGRERKTIDYVARTIREREYITTEKRGSGAADMTIREAVNLLIAVNGTDVPKESPLAIDRFRSLVQHFAGNATLISEHVDKINWTPEPIRHVTDARTFGEALERLVETVPDLFRSFYDEIRKSFEHIPEKLLRGSMKDLIQHRLIGPEITFRDHSAKIEFFEPLTIPTQQSGFGGDKTRISRLLINYKPDSARGPDFYGAGLHRIVNPTDRYISIGFATLIQVHSVLNGSDGV